MNIDQTQIQQCIPSVYTTHRPGKPAVVNIGVLMSCDELHKL